MKKIFKFMLLPALVLPLLFTSCDDERRKQLREQAKAATTNSEQP